MAISMGSAKAAEWSMDVGGFYTVGLGFVNDNIYSDQAIAIINDGEIHFDPSITLDNGIKFGAHVELEAQTGAIDESDAFIKGSFGTVRIGANDGAQGSKLGNVCPTFTCADDGILDRTGASSIDINGGNSSDDLKISYFSPSFSGFSAAVSYIPDDTTNPAATRIGGNNDDNSFEVGAGYSNSFGDFSVGLGVGYYYKGWAVDENNFGVTGNVGFGGFTVGASYGSNNGGDDTAYGFGLTYDTGPWNFGAHYGDRLDAGGVSSDEWNAGLGASYKIASGVTTGATLEFGDDGSNDLFGGALFLALSF
jgi:predicted porin